VNAIEELGLFALAFEGAFEDHPWGPEPTVFKAANGKMFVMAWPEEAKGALAVTVKLTPDEAGAALGLPFVRVAPYLGRYSWITADVTSEVEMDIALEWVRRSWELVTARGKRRSGDGR
jgi:predicted DNA-binding protein (MmcQ/YjbR family)